MARVFGTNWTARSPGARGDISQIGVCAAGSWRTASSAGAHADFRTGSGFDFMSCLIGMDIGQAVSACAPHWRSATTTSAGLL